MRDQGDNGYANNRNGRQLPGEADHEHQGADKSYQVPTWKMIMRRNLHQLGTTHNVHVHVYMLMFTVHPIYCKFLKIDYRKLNQCQCIL